MLTLHISFASSFTKSHKRGQCPLRTTCRTSHINLTNSTYTPIATYTYTPPCHVSPRHITLRHALHNLHPPTNSPTPLFPPPLPTPHLTHPTTSPAHQATHIAHTTKHVHALNSSKNPLPRHHSPSLHTHAPLAAHPRSRLPNHHPRSDRQVYSAAARDTGLSRT